MLGNAQFAASEQCSVNYDAPRIADIHGMMSC